MTDRAESIMSAIATSLAGAGLTVERGRVNAWPEGSLPAYDLDMGSEDAAGEPNISYQDEFLDVEITAHVQNNSGVDTSLNASRAAVYAAVMADRTQGLSYVHDTIWVGRSAPDRTGESSKKTARQTLLFRIHYRHSYTSSEA